MTATRQPSVGPKGRRGFWPKGSAHHQSKLKEDDVRAIRVRAEAGEKQQAIGRFYGVSCTTIGNIIRRVNWKHVA